MDSHLLSFVVVDRHKKMGRFATMELQISLFVDFYFVACCRYSGAKCIWRETIGCHVYPIYVQKAFSTNTDSRKVDSRHGVISYFWWGKGEYKLDLHIIEGLIEIEKSSFQCSIS